MSNAPLMPKATAVWLLDNTALTFDQVADFTKMHPLEIRAIADGDAAQGIKGMDPISSGQLTREEIEKGEKDSEYRLRLEESKVVLPPAAKRKGPRYTPVSRRHERPSAILWLVRNHPELKDAQIMRLVGTTKTTIASVRDRTHWNASTLTPMDPVTLGLCSQIELDFEVQRAAKEKPVPANYGGATLLPASETTRKEEAVEQAEKSSDDLNVDAVFAKLKTIGGKKAERRSKGSSRAGLGLRNAAGQPAAFLFWPGAQPYFSFINRIPPASTIVMALATISGSSPESTPYSKPKQEAEHHDEKHSKRNVLRRAGSPSLYELRGIGNRRARCGSKPQQLDCNRLHARPIAPIRCVRYCPRRSSSFLLPLWEKVARSAA